MQAQNPFSPEYLRKYSSQHLLYEVEMFFHLGHLLMVGQFIAHDPNLTSVLHNGIIEAFILHLRNILDFFYTRPRKSDVGATMFYDSGERPETFPAKSALLNEAHRRAHKEMSHLTTERHWEGDPKKVWQFAKLMQDVRPLLKAFLETASATRLDPAFIDRAKALVSVK